MKVSVTLEFDSPAEAQAALAKLGGAAAPAAGKPAPAADKPAASSPTAAPTPPAAPVKKYEDTAIPKLIKDKAADAKVKPLVIELLKKFGVAKGPELKPEQFDAFAAEIQALKAPEEDLG